MVGSDFPIVTKYIYPFDSNTSVSRSPVAVKEYQPVKTNPILALDDPRPVLIWFKDMQYLADKFLATGSFRPSFISWEKYENNWDKVYFEPELQGKHVMFLFSGEHPETFFIQRSMLIALPRQGIQSLTIL